MSEQLTPNELQAERRVLIGQRANALVKSGFLTKGDVLWLREFSKREGVFMLEVEYLLLHAEMAEMRIKEARSEGQRNKEAG